jgi:thymidine kinase
MTCGDPANFTQRLTASQDQIVVGAQETYEARCRQHFEPPAREKMPAPETEAGQAKG